MRFAPATFHVPGQLNDHYHILTTYQDSPLATNLNYSVGHAQITVPDVPSRTDYIVVCKWPSHYIICHAHLPSQCSVILVMQVLNLRSLTMHLHPPRWLHPLPSRLRRVLPPLPYQPLLLPHLQPVQILPITLATLPRHP